MTDQNLLQLAKAQIAHGDLDDAEATLAARARIQPVPEAVVLLLSELRFKRNLLAEAIQVLEQHKALRNCATQLREYYIGERFNSQASSLIQSIPKSGSSDDLLDQAALLQLAGDARSAAVLCRKVLTMDSNNAHAYNHLGRALFNSGAGSDALAAFESALGLKPDYYQAWHNIGHVRRAQADFKGAESAYRKAIELAPFYQSALLNLALLKMSQGDNQSAISSLQALLKINPAQAEALLNLGICHQIERNYSEAESAFLSASTAAPNDARIWRHLGGLYRELQDSNKGIECFRNALQIEPLASDVRAELISTLELINELDQAESVIADGLALQPDDANILFESAKIYRRRGEHEAAYARFHALNQSDLHPRLRQSFHYELATAADRLGHYDEAFEAYQRGNEMALTSIRARNTSKTALIQQMDAVERWLQTGAPSAQQADDEDLGDDLCFLIGFPRSGTTLLDVMLDGHTQVLSLEEKPTIERVAFKLDQLPGHYPFAMNTCNAQTRAQLRSVYREQITQYRNAGHRLVIDKMPIRTIHAAFIHRLFPNARFLFAKRHPCDVVLSNFMQQYAINEAMIHFTRLDSAVSVYDRVMRLWQLSMQKLPRLHVHNVRYEALLEKPEQTLRDTCDFLGLPWQSGIENHQNTIAQRQQIKTNSYHQVAQPIYQRSKFRWLNYQTQLKPYMSVLQQHIDRMGY
jgi:tetratricopeptide (TPR) repeat protein